MPCPTNIFVCGDDVRLQEGSLSDAAEPRMRQGHVPYRAGVGELRVFFVISMSNTLFFVCNSLFLASKFPVPLSREFADKSLCRLRNSALAPG